MIKKILKKSVKNIKSIKQATKKGVKKTIAKNLKIIKKTTKRKTIKNVSLKTNKYIESDNTPKVATLERSLHNPIIAPRSYSFESRATFNPTAVESNGKVHLIYRAIGDDDVSSLGYASSFNGYKLDERLTHFIYRRFKSGIRLGEYIGYASGGGWSGGAEDPRATVLDGRVYVLFNAFDGWSSVRVAMISMDLEDFRNKRWNKWSKQIFLSPPNEINKAWVLFPEKINGKMAILHDLWPSVAITYFDSFDDFESGKVKIKQSWDRWFHSRIPTHWVYVNAGTDGGRFVDPEAFNKNIWKEIEKDLWVRNAGPAPIKTPDGWLVIFHAIEARDPGKYKLFAMLLDLKDPTRVLYRSQGPILEPQEYYESDGWRSIVYSCGAVVKSGRLFVYYGAGDRVVGVASIKMQTLLEDLKTHKAFKLKIGEITKSSKKK